MQPELRRVIDAARALEGERRPVILVVPHQHRRKQRERQPRGEIRLGPEQLTARAPIDERECERAGAEQRDRVLGEQPESDARAHSPPRSRPQLDEREPQKEERPGPRRREGRVGSHEHPRREPEGQRGGERERRGGGGPAEPARGQRRREADRRERTADRARAHAPLTVTEQRRARRDEPGDERRVIEIGQREVLRVAPVVGFFRQELDRARVGDAQDEQIQCHRDTAEAQRERALVRSARRREHEERCAERSHSEPDERARHEREQRTESRVARQALERAATQQEREQAHGCEAHPGASAQIAPAEREHRERGERAGREMRARERDATPHEEREDREVDDGGCAQRDPESAQARRAELRSGERRETAEILARLRRPELRLAALPVDELDRNFDEARARADAREQLEQDLEPRGGVVERGDVRSPRGEEARHRVTHRRDRPGERGGGARHNFASQRPAPGRAPRSVPAADRETRRAVEQRPHQRGDRRDRMREVGVHHDHDVRTRGARARDHGASEPALLAPHDHADAMTRRPGARAFRGSVAGVVVDDDHLERGHGAPEREDLREQLVDVLGLVERGHHDRERRRYLRFDRFHGSGADADGAPFDALVSS